MKGDRVEIAVDSGGGTTRTYDIGATVLDASWPRRPENLPGSARLIPGVPSQLLLMSSPQPENLPGSARLIPGVPSQLLLMSSPLGLKPWVIALVERPASGNPVADEQVSALRSA